MLVGPIGPIGSIQMHQPILNSHFIDNNVNHDYDNVAFSVPHLYYARHIKQEIVSESDTQSAQQNCFPFFNKNRMSYDSNRLIGSTQNSMYSVKKAALVWPGAGAPEGGVHGKSGSSGGLIGISGGGVNSSLVNSPPVSGATSGRPVSPNSGLVHWVSVMADHAHVPSPAHSVGQHVDSASVHYMWNGAIEPKLSSDNQHNSINKGPNNNVDEGRSGSGGLDSSPSLHHNLYGSHASGNRATNNNSRPPTPSGQQMLVVPQPVKSSNTLSSAPTTNGTGRKYQCKMCPQIFGSKADMQLHTQIHMREAKPYKCSQCSKAFANSSYLSQHTRIHLGIKPYRCEICQRKFTQLSHLQQHIRTHTGDKPYKCRHPGCNKAFSQLSNLQSHSRCHQTDKPYKCNSCYKCFTDETSLLEHIPKHKESKHLKTHICQYCGKSYTQETYLAKHMQKHADRVDKRTGLIRAAHTSSEGYWSKSGAVAGSSSGQSNQNNDCSPDLPPHLHHHHHHHHHHHQQEQSCLGSVLNTDQSTSSRYSRSELDQTQHRLSGGQHLSAGTSNGRTSDELMYNIDPKTSTSVSASAFTPIQTSGVLSGSNVARSAVAAAYFPYESFGFPSKAVNSGMPGMEIKSAMDVSKASGHTSFPNQLIALHQIRNYASMPSSAASAITGEHPISLKDKHSQ